MSLEPKYLFCVCLSCRLVEEDGASGLGRLFQLSRMDFIQSPQPDPSIRQRATTDAVASR